MSAHKHTGDYLEHMLAKTVSESNAIFQIGSVPGYSHIQTNKKNTRTHALNANNGTDASERRAHSVIIITRRTRQHATLLTMDAAWRELAKSSANVRSGAKFSDVYVCVCLYTCVSVRACTCTQHPRRVRWHTSLFLLIAARRHAHTRTHWLRTFCCLFAFRFPGVFDVSRTAYR